VGALSFVAANSSFEKRSLIVGNPAKKIKDVSDTMISWKTKGTALYQALPKECQDTLVECEPLREIEEDRPQQEAMYTTWNSIK
jgi:carbonic anhydrase/acetyltransferase-like protein (isoleucine patch superfamily)